MRCLYCGKELALFKRLRGGEFCSDAHRQSYQEEYTQLALNRLLQANSPNEAEPTTVQGARTSDSKASTKASDTKPSETRPPDAKPMDARPMDTRPLETPALKRRERQTREEAPVAPAAAAARESFAKTPPQTFAPVASVAAPADVLQQIAVLDPEPMEVAAEAPAESREEAREEAPAEAVHAPAEVVAEPAPEEPPPAAPAGLFIEVPLPVVPEIAVMAKPEAGLLSFAAPALPRRQEFRLDRGVLCDAGPVPQPRFAPAYSGAAPRERGLEVREFVRSLPVVEIRLAPAGEAGFANSWQSDSQQIDSQMLDVDFELHPPQDLPPLWQAAPREFPIPDAVFAESAWLDFETTAWPDVAKERPREGVLRESMLLK